MKSIKLDDIDLIYEKKHDSYGCFFIHSKFLQFEETKPTVGLICIREQTKTRTMLLIMLQCSECW